MMANPGYIFAVGTYSLPGIPIGQENPEYHRLRACNSLKLKITHNIKLFHNNFLCTTDFIIS
jgi:hypothetical protein